MKIFDSQSEGGWGTKVNFADSNNVFVGYDMDQSCCENADWFISTSEDNIPQDSHGITENLEEYSFDKDYFVQVENPKDLDAGDMIRFRLIAEGKQILFLHLYNCHNGYYEHGFEMKINDVEVREGTL